MLHRARYPRILLVVLVVAVSAVMFLYGIFALAYGGDGSSATYVTLGRHRIDAHLTGAISLVLGVALALLGRLVISTWRGRRIKPWSGSSIGR